MLLDGSPAPAQAISASASPLLLEVNVAVNEVLLCAGVVALLLLRQRVARHRRQLDRAYAQALAQAARHAKWAACKAVAVAVLVIAAWTWLGAHA